MKSKTAFLYGPKDLRMEEVEVPKLKPDQVLVQTGACGICGSDVECYEGGSAEGRYDIGPYTPGHAISAVLEHNKQTGFTGLKFNHLVFLKLL